jgi:hypothetical protein
MDLQANMTYQHQGFDSPSGAPAQHSTFSPEYDERGQHVASCLYVSWLGPVPE